MPYFTSPQNLAMAAQQRSMFATPAGVPPTGGFFDHAGGWLGDHSNALIQGGLALAGGQGFAGAGQGFARGTEMDQSAADRKQAKADRKRLDDALQGLAADQSPNSPTAGLSGPVRNLMAADPGFAASVISSRISPKADDWQRLSDGSLYKPSTGETKAVAGGKREIKNDSNGVPRYVDTGDAVYQSDQSANTGTQFFSGKSVQAQGLNHLIGQGLLTKDQAAEVAAGKTVTGPNGEIIFMTPEGIFAKPGAGQSGDQQGGATGQGMTQLTGPKYSEDMKKAGGFATRATAADQIISNPEVSNAAMSRVERGAAAVPVFGNSLVSENYQSSDQAERDFINAVLRRESGAAISSSEFENANMQYWPQPGDGPKVLAQKAQNRKFAVDSLRMSADPVPTFGQQNAPQAQGTASPSSGSLTPHPNGDPNHFVWQPTQ